MGEGQVHGQLGRLLLSVRQGNPEFLNVDVEHIRSFLNDHDEDEHVKISSELLLIQPGAYRVAC